MTNQITNKSIVCSFRSHSNSKSFHTRTDFSGLNIEFVRISDPHYITTKQCILKVMTLKAKFQLKSYFFQYGENVPKWSLGCDLSPNSTSSDITNLESSIHSHQSLYENMCQAYTEVHSTSKKLLYQLDHLVQTCCANQNIPPDDRKHVRNLIMSNQGLKYSTNLCVQKIPGRDSPKSKLLFQSSIVNFMIKAKRDSCVVEVGESQL